jgi:Rrf2 family protein
MLVTARAEYACLAMLELASHYGDPKPLRLAELADQHGIPQRFLVQILLQMKSAGLVQTTRGASGGYHLALPPEEITLADILGVLESDDEPSERQVSPSAMASNLQQVWKGLGEARTQYLKNHTLASLLPKPSDGDYMI